MRRAISGFGFLAGVSYPFRTLAVFRRMPHLWGYLVTPILVNFILGIFVYAGLLFFGWQITQNGLEKLADWLDNLITSLPSRLGILEYLLIPVGFLLHFLLIFVLLILTGFLLAQFGVLLGAPWYGKLSEQLEKTRTGQVEIVEVGIIRDIWRAILFELKKLGLMVGFGLPLLGFNFIPGLGTLISTVGGIALSATIVCLDFLDAPLERRRLRFRDKLKIIFKSLPASAGFSLTCLVLISIPLLNLITIPLCVASGTLFFCDRLA